MSATDPFLLNPLRRYGPDYRYVTGQQLLRFGEDGTASAPTLSWDDDPDTGIYRASGDIQFAVGGASRMYISSGAVHFAEPLNIDNYTDTIFYADGGSVANVTQATNNNTAVTLNSCIGRITMQSAIATGTSHQFQLNNTKIATGMVMLLSVQAETANNVPPTVSWVTPVADTSVQIVIRNNDGAAATTAAPVVHFWILGTAGSI